MVRTFLQIDKTISVGFDPRRSVNCIRSFASKQLQRNIEPSLIDPGSQKSSGTFRRSWKIPLTQPASLTNL